MWLVCLEFLSVLGAAAFPDSRRCEHLFPLKNSVGHELPVGSSWVLRDSSGPSSGQEERAIFLLFEL